MHSKVQSDYVENHLAVLCRLTGARSVTRQGTRIQRLWSGYGEIFRVSLPGGTPSTAVIKHVEPPDELSTRHPRGWGGARSHARKLRSYAVEQAWYQNHASRCGARCRVPRLLDAGGGDGQWWLVLEDLDASGFSARRSAAAGAELRQCLAWLARLHVEFLGAAPEDLWPSGTYWHLATRPEEWQAMPHGALREAAEAIDARLLSARFVTVVHGDAKLANFCFAPGGGGVAAVDFQYCGGGPGVKDVAYLLSSALDEATCLAQGEGLFEYYLSELQRVLGDERPEVDAGAWVAECRELWPFAWADYLRFLQGWAPGHVRSHGYSQRMVERALAVL